MGAHPERVETILAGITADLNMPTAAEREQV